MTLLAVIFIGLSLSMDAFAVCVGAGISAKGIKTFHMIRASFFFGLFQFIMPAAGWYLGTAFAARIQTFDHWIAFGLLFFIGAKMIWETAKGEDASADIRSLPALLTLAFATSIDALAVGLSLSLLGQAIWFPAAVIGLITFAVCISGFGFARLIGARLGKWAGIAGGLVLIGIGTKILIEHLTQ